MFKQIINIVVIKSIGDLCPSIERIKVNISEVKN